MTEFDPMWNDDEFSMLINPEASLFANPIAQAVCSVDALKAAEGFPIDRLFWCAGSWGSIYPFTGTVPTSGNLPATYGLTAVGLIAKLHREGSSTSNRCVSWYILLHRFRPAYVARRCKQDGKPDGNGYMQGRRGGCAEDLTSGATAATGDDLECAVPQGNLVWKGLKKLNLPDEVREQVMSTLGTIIVETENNINKVVYKAPILTPSDLVNGGQVKVYRCDNL